MTFSNPLFHSGKHASHLTERDAVARSRWGNLGLVVLLISACFSATSQAQQHTFTWQELRDKFEVNNTTLLAGRLNIDELRAEEITAFLRPNPQLSLTVDGTQIAPRNGKWPVFAGTYEVPGVSYLHERLHKRELRQQSAKEGTAIGRAQQDDLERNLLFNLRSAFVGVLQAKAVLRLAQDNLDYYDKVLKISGDRYQAGDIAQIDLDRLELQRLQYESDLQAALVNLRTTKINLLALLDDRRPVDSFDVEGAFDFGEDVLSLDAYRKAALDARPDLRAALLSVQQAETNYKLAEANGSTDPTFGAWYTHNASDNNPLATNTLGVNVSVPLRIFDRNQGEKLRTKIDIRRSEKLRDGVQTQVYSDVDSGYAVLNSNITLLKPYKRKYLEQAVRVRDTVFFSYQHGGAALLDFLNAESDYRTVQLNYLNLVGTYLMAAAQVNLAVGREVIQ
jgi:cobalt-zinc-cadmium efflux system outer membrane protein